MIDKPKSDAVILYLSVGRSSYPKEDPGALDHTFGPQGAELGSYVKGIVSEMLAIPIDWQAHSGWSWVETIQAEMHLRHPELSEEAIQALGWYISYTLK
ncbi:MAG TPA: hypothetical protein VKR06_34835 [Ktedonosporobacter sp.]|nr:hypothetical protein [Ktedonosporobacter sp.]